MKTRIMQWSIFLSPHEYYSWYSGYVYMVIKSLSILNITNNRYLHKTLRTSRTDVQT